MYAVIRAGGKQYRVSPGDVIKVEKMASDNGRIEFSDVLAVSGDDGGLGRGTESLVVGSVVAEARAPKILVFHFKRKKQYKKLQGHRQPYTAVRIVEISSGGKKYTAPALPEKKVKAVSHDGSHTGISGETKEPSGRPTAHETDVAGASPKRDTKKQVSSKKSATKSATRKATAGGAKKADTSHKLQSRQSSDKSGKKPKKK